MKFALILTALFLMPFRGPGLVASHSQVEGGTECPRKIMVLVELVQPGTFTEYRRYEAVFAPESMVAKTPRAGMVTDIKVSDGDRVSTGYVLVMLNEGMAKELESVDAELADWKKKLWKREHWKERNPRAEAEARMRIAELEARRNALLEDTAVAIPSPMTGVVELLVTPGTEVNAGDEVARVINRRRKWATLEVQAEDVDLFATGREISLGSGLTARVTVTHENRVKLVVDDFADRLGGEPKLFRIRKREVREAIILPRERILRDGSGNHVFLVNGDTASRVDLEIGAEYAGRVQITAGIRTGELLITAQLLSRKTGEIAASMDCLEDGKRISIMEKDPESGRFIKYRGEIPVRNAQAPDNNPEPEVDETESMLRDPCHE